MLNRRDFVVSVASLAALGLSRAARAAAPSRIRIGVAMTGLGGRPFSLGGYISALHVQQLLEREFAADGTAVSWQFFAGEGPAVNEALAQGALDFAWQGDLPELVARSRGLATRQLLVAGSRMPVLLAANKHAGITGIASLKGKSVANFQGTNLQLSVDRILASAGLSEHDVHIVNLDQTTGAQAVAQGQIDATFAVLALPQRLAARLDTVFVTGPRTPTFTTQNSFIVTEQFAAAHPDAVDRVVRVAVQAAHWSSQEKNRAALYEIFDKSGYPPDFIRTAFDGLDLKIWNSPLWDGFGAAQLSRSAADSFAYGLVRTPVSVSNWIDPAPLRRALAATGLTGFWPSFSPDGLTRLS